jgi:hypothetical protein
MVNDTRRAFRLHHLVMHVKRGRNLFDLRFTIGTFVETFVCFHVECHVAFCTLEACLVPGLEGN